MENIKIYIASSTLTGLWTSSVVAILLYIFCLPRKRRTYLIVPIALLGGCIMVLVLIFWAKAIDINVLYVFSFVGLVVAIILGLFLYGISKVVRYRE